MTMTPQLPTEADRKPLDDEIDFYGMTHKGKIRAQNEDHFLICSLRKQMQVYLTSLPSTEPLRMGTERLAFLAMVADGVGGGPKGEEASRLTTEAVTHYVARSMDCYYTADATDQESFTRTLEKSAMRCHEDVVKRAEEDPGYRGMATTLTLWLGVWPLAYLLHVGDSRAYLLRDGRLTQLSRDQTMAQDLVDQGILSAADASNSRLAHVLSSAIGGRETEPVVRRIEQRWNDIGLLCSDGLTKHVSDERIRERLIGMTSAKQACEDLLEDALAGGGTDNITVLVARTVKKNGLKG
jgi:serine/threonine protein phosphatase PrpC